MGFKTDIRGSIVALVTPMLDGGEVDYATLAQLVEWHIAEGTNAIVAVGTTGESATLSVDEHCAVIKTVVDVAKGRVAVIAGTGANSTTEAIELTAAAHRVGADACLSVTPYYNKPTQEGLYLHHKAIAEAVPIPNILYNVPGRTAVDMSAKTTARLAEIANIVGIKDATGDMQRGRDLLEGCPDDFAIFSGDDETAVELMLMGGRGNISVTANIAPRRISQLAAAAIDAQNQSDTVKADVKAKGDILSSLHAAMFVEANPIPVKAALVQMGKLTSAIRLPLTPLSTEYVDGLRAELVKFELV